MTDASYTFVTLSIKSPDVGDIIVGQRYDCGEYNTGGDLRPQDRQHCVDGEQSGHSVQVVGVFGHCCVYVG